MDMKDLTNIPPWEWPEDAGNMILAVLEDDRAEEPERLLAAELAGEYTVVNDELAEALLAIVGSADETDELRGAASISLGPALEEAFTMDFDDDDEILISEKAFHRIQQSLHKLFLNADVPRYVRRRILETSVRAPHEWHSAPIRAAYSSDDREWALTAVFCMRFVRGFEAEILESLESDDPDIHYEAVCAAGNWEVDAAWSHIASLITAKDTEKDLLLAAIDAAVYIRPQEAPEILLDLTASKDGDVAEAALEAMSMIAGTMEYEDDDEDDDDDYLH
jgi:hypothetical protein